MRPPWLFPLGVALAVVLALAWTAAAYRLGATAEGNKVRADWQTERTANARHVANALERTLDAQAALGEGLARRDAQHSKEMQRVQDERDGFDDRLRRGTVRVSVPARVPACAAGSGQPVGPLAGPGQAHAELDPAFAQHLVRITSEGDAAIVELNACVDKYNAVRDSSATLKAAHRAQTP